MLNQIIYHLNQPNVRSTGVDTAGVGVVRLVTP